MPQPNLNIVNRFGQVQGFADFEFNMMSNDIIGIKEIAYNSEQEVEGVYGKGRYPIGSGAGNVKSSASMSLLFEEWQSLLSSIPSGKTYFDLEFDITVTYDVNGVAKADIIRNCRIMKADRTVAQGDKETVIKIELYTSHVNENINI